MACRFAIRLTWFTLHLIVTVLFDGLERKKRRKTVQVVKMTQSDQHSTTKCAKRARYSSFGQNCRNRASCSGHSLFRRTSQWAHKTLIQISARSVSPSQRSGLGSNEKSEKVSLSYDLVFMSSMASIKWALMSAIWRTLSLSFVIKIDWNQVS